MKKKTTFDLKLIVELDEDCIKDGEDPGAIFTEAVGEMQNKLNEVFPSGLGLPHAELKY